MSELLIGCGNRHKKMIWVKNEEDFKDLTTVDIDPNCKADIIHDLNVLPWPFDSNMFDEVHAYEVLEHLGRQGDYASFFSHFEEIWRVLKDGGLLFATTPTWNMEWAWGDPGHTRIIGKASLTFLNQLQYGQVGSTPMTDYRSIYKGDLRVVMCEETDTGTHFILQAFKGEKWGVEEPQPRITD
jgi:hypothetical protein